MQPRSISANLPHRSPSRRRRARPARRLPGIPRALVGAAIASLLLFGCVTAPTRDETRSAGEVIAVDGGKVSLSEADRRFLSGVDAYADTTAAEAFSPRVELFFSFDCWPAARNHVSTVFSESTRVLDRVERGVWWVGASGSVLIAEVSVSRFATSIGLNTSGWDRVAWGVWTDPEGSATLRFLPDRRWLVTVGALQGQNPAVPAVTADNLIFPTGTPTEAAVVGRIERPELPTIPERLRPRELRFLVSNEGVGTLVLPFDDERRARVALVPLRLRTESVVASYGFRVRDDFDIFRREDEVIVVGVEIVSLTFPERDVARILGNAREE